MYRLGDQFVFDYEKAKANESCIFQGEKYRITVLTERLVRLEYSETGVFEDRPTELVWYRQLEKPVFTVKEDTNYLEISTKYFKLSYSKNKKFIGSKINPGSNLRIDLLGTEKYWYYNHLEVRNLGAPTKELFDKNGKIKHKKALYSADGFVSIDDSNSKIFQQTGVLLDREVKTMDTYVFLYLNDFEACLQDYYKITEYPALIPRFALGNWWSRNETYSDVTLKKLMDDFAENEIPLSVLLLGHHWHTSNDEKKNKTNSGFTFDKQLFQHPYEMIGYLHSKGIRLGLTIDPFDGIYANEEQYEKMKQYFETNKQGVIPFAVFNPKWLDAYLKLMIHPLDALEVDFFWIDPTKYEPKELWALNHYHKQDMTRNYKRRPMVLSTNAGIGPHRYPVLYSGRTKVSWDTLRSIPFHNVSASNIGVAFWSHDIGGYTGGIEDNELYTRFVQLGVFSPILKFGSDKGKYYKREPWRWSLKTYNIVKNYLQLRHRLIPYLYSESYQYHKNGKQFIKPLYHKYPEFYDDEKFRNDYYLGSQMFISPIVQKKDYVMNRVIHKFFIPDGIWYDFVTGKKFPGGRNYVSFFRDQDYPVFVKSGAIIPLGDYENLNDTTPPKNMEIQIFPGTSNYYELYEDDGISDLYKRGFFLKTAIDYNYLPNNYTVIVRAIEGKRGIVPDRRDYVFRFRNTKKSDQVIAYFNNAPIETNSYVDGPDFIVQIKDVSTIGQLTVNCKGKDIETDAVRLINDDFEGIIADLQIETEMKEKIDSVLFGDLPLKKKRLEIRKLRSKGLEPKFIKLFLKLLDYLGQV